MSDVNKIDTFIIKSLQKDFYNESVNFNNSTYRTFSSSYIRNCSDVYVQRMNNTLNSLYVKIRDGYSNINKWWTNYNENISELEISLSNDVNGGQITESAVRSYVNSLPKLETYNIKNMGSISKAVAGVIETATFVNNNVVVGTDMFSNLYTEYNSVNVEKTVSNEVTDFFSDVGTVVSGTAKSIWTKVKGWGNNVKNWWEKDAVPFFKTAVSKSCDVLKSTGATVVTFAQSLTEGVLKFGESIVDFLAIAGTGVGSIFTGAYDLGKAIGCKMYGVEYKSTTSSMWKDTMGFVSKDYVGGWFNKLYDNTTYGKWLKENAYFFDGTRSVGSGIGYIAGVVALTIATFGVGSVVSAGGSVTVTTAAAATTTAKTAIVAGLAGMGKGTEKAWAEGAGIGKGLVAGTLTGAWEGLQFWVGGKISEATIGGSKILTKVLGQKNSWAAISNSKILNRVFRVGLDSADGGVEGFIQPLIESIYKTEYLDSEGNYIEYNKNYFKRVGEVFTTTGGLKNVAMQTLIGGIGSSAGEAFELGKYFNNNNRKLLNFDDINARFKNLVDIDDVELAKYINGMGQYDKDLLVLFDTNALSDSKKKIIYNQQVLTVKSRMNKNFIAIYDDGVKTGRSCEFFAGFEEHNFLHVSRVADSSIDIASKLNESIKKGKIGSGFQEADLKLVEISGYLHDLGMKNKGVRKFDEAVETLKDYGYIVDTKTSTSGYTTNSRKFDVDADFNLKTKINPEDIDLLEGMGYKVLGNRTDGYILQGTTIATIDSLNKNKIIYKLSNSEITDLKTKYHIKEYDMNNDFKYNYVYEIINDEKGKIIRANHANSSSIFALMNRDKLGDNADEIALICALHSKSCSGVANVTSAQQLTASMRAIDDMGKFTDAYKFDINKFVEVDKNNVPIIDIITENDRQYETYRFKPGTLERISTEAAALRLGDAHAVKTGFNHAAGSIDVIKRSVVDDTSIYKNQMSDKLNDLCKMEASKSEIRVIYDDDIKNIAGGDLDFSKRVILGEKNSVFKDYSITDDGVIEYTFDVRTVDAPASTWEYGIKERFGEYKTIKGINHRAIINLPPDIPTDLRIFYENMADLEDGVEIIIR